MGIQPVVHHLIQRQTSKLQPPLQSAVISGAGPFRFQGDINSIAFKGHQPTVQQNVFQRFWHWFKSIPSNIAGFFKGLFGRTSEKTTQSGKVEITKPNTKRALYSHIDPKLVSDPYERHRISTDLAESTFDDVVRYYQNQTVEKGENGVYQSWNGLSGKKLTEQAQKLLNTNTEAKVIFLDNRGLHLGCSHPPYKHINGPTSSRTDMGTVEVIHPTNLEYDLNIPGHRQLAFATYAHELQHMVRNYAYNIAEDSAKLPHPLATDPVKDLYSKKTTGAVQSASPDVLKYLLTEDNPHLPPINIHNYDILTRYTSDNIQCYWKPLQEAWERKDFKVLFKPDNNRDFKEINQLLAQGDPILIKEYMHKDVVSELESYMTSFKRAPGLPKDRLQPADFEQFGAALYLRDLLRYYYQHPRHKVPLGEQHPMAQVKPFNEIWNYYNNTNL